MLSDLTELGMLHLYGDSPAGPQGAMCHLRPLPTHSPPPAVAVPSKTPAEC